MTISTITMVAMNLAKNLAQAQAQAKYMFHKEAPVAVLTQLMCQAIELAIETGYALDDIDSLSNHPLFFETLADAFDLDLIGDGVSPIQFLEDYFSMSVEDSFWDYLDVDCIEGVYNKLTEDTHIVRYASLNYSSDEIHWYFDGITCLKRALLEVDPTVELEF